MVHNERLLTPQANESVKRFAGDVVVVRIVPELPKLSSRIWPGNRLGESLDSDIIETAVLDRE